MLVLTRRIGESVHIGDDIQVVILSSKNNQVRIGIAAPKEVPIHREEIYSKHYRDDPVERHATRPLSLPDQCIETGSN